MPVVSDSFSALDDVADAAAVDWPALESAAGRSFEHAANAAEKRKMGKRFVRRIVVLRSLSSELYHSQLRAFTSRQGFCIGDPTHFQ
jgi:hypothetical protein